MGYIQVYTGNGKGKTTASLGLSLRAHCAGNNVLFAQFLKDGNYSEAKASQDLKNLEFRHFGAGGFIVNTPSQKDIDCAREGLEFLKEAVKSGKYGVIVMDEINVALFYKLFTVEEVIEMLESRTDDVEIILTGRYAPEKLIEYADLVTEMREIKHYYTQGVDARVGIEK